MLPLAITCIDGGVGKPPEWKANKVCLRGEREVVLQLMSMPCTQRILETVIRIRLF